MEKGYELMIHRRENFIGHELGNPLSLGMRDAH